MITHQCYIFNFEYLDISIDKYLSYYKINIQNIDIQILFLHVQIFLNFVNI